MGHSLLIALLEEGTEPNLRAWLETGTGRAAAAQSGFEVKTTLIKSPRQRDALVAEIRHSPPDVIFLPVYRSQREAANALLLMLRRASVSTCAVVGGPLGTLAADVFTFNPGTDALLVGEWESVLPGFLEEYGRTASGEGVAGVWWREGEDWHLTPAKKPVEKLDDLPAPDFDGLPIGDLLDTNGRRVPIEASRGCPFSCTFCHVPLIRLAEHPGDNHRRRTAATVVSEAQRLGRAYDAREFLFVDDLFPWQDDWIADFASQWKRQVRKPFHITTCTEHLTPARLEQLAGAGLGTVNIGVETGSEEKRRLFSGRNLSNGAIATLAEEARRLGVDLRTHLILGLPGIDQAEMDKTVQFLRGLGISEAVPHRLKNWPQKRRWNVLEHGGLSVEGLEISGSPGRAETVVAAEQKEALGKTLERLRHLNWKLKTEGRQNRDGVDFDALASLSQARIRSHHAAPFKVDTYSAPNGTHEVLSLCVPTELSWQVELPPDAVLQFGILLEPALPGARVKSPICFSVKVETGGSVYRVFQKVFLQSRDPDSRQWHHFEIPLRIGSPGPAQLMISSTLFGRDSSVFPPEGEVWGGWAGPVVTSKPGAVTLVED